MGAAADIIDWSIAAPRIGDRVRPLAEKTMARIRSGLEKYGAALVPVEGRDGKQPFGVDRPMRTCTGRNETGLLVPAGGTWNDTAYLTDQPARTVTTRETTGVVVPPFVAELRGGGSKHRPVSEPLATVCASGNHHGLVEPALSVEDCGFRMLQAHEYAAAMTFPASYRWRGSKRDRVRMAGNAVPCNMARDLVACGVESMA
ncbi:DNA cytosine methyltransferase [Streptomyces stackebrandtii]|uniref:DNA cytosine methyltransferase n=1 Tax=Streptomyces stackebrandtii TaxID=3051177 RepID=UPI0028DC20CD|nr:DNA cytosine methyltransferase [Streptomyces sp. DSM 40976]